MLTKKPKDGKRLATKTRKKVGGVKTTAIAGNR